MNGGRSDSSLSSAEEPDSGSQSGTESPIIPESDAGGESPVVSDSSQSIVSEPEDEERIPFFESVAAELAECENFFEVQKVSSHLTGQLERFPLPESSTFNLASCQIDSNATRLLQPEIQQRCVALSVAGDGNCFFPALSLLLFCSEKFHVEMRCRIVMAMAVNPELFLDGHNWCAEEDQVSPEEVLRVARLTSVAPVALAAVSFQEEVMSVLQNHNFTGLWEFFAASHVLQRPIQSVYPSLGWPIYKLHCNRIIRAPGCVGSDKLYVMWSSDRTDTVSEHWVPNHFVPVVLRTQTAGVPLRGSFHLIQWNRMEYVGQAEKQMSFWTWLVLALCPENQTASCCFGLSVQTFHGNHLVHSRKRCLYTWWRRLPLKDASIMLLTKIDL